METSSFTIAFASAPELARMALPPMNGAMIGRHALSTVRHPPRSPRSQAEMPEYVEDEQTPAPQSSLHM